MEQLLKSLRGKLVDVSCGTAVIYCGSVVEVEGGLLHLRDETDGMCYIVLDKISTVSERKDAHSRPGFIGA